MGVRKKIHKYKAVRTSGFPSKLEFAVNQYLELLEKAGEIKDLQRQRAVELELYNQNGEKIKKPLKSKIDFSYIDTKTNRLVYAEAKGFYGERFKLIKRFWSDCVPHDLIIYGGRHNNVKILEIVKGYKNG